MIKKKQHPPKSLRDNLMSMLYFKHNFDLAKLAALFRLTKRYVKALLKDTLYQTDITLAYKEANASHLNSRRNDATETSLLVPSRYWNYTAPYKVTARRIDRLETDLPTFL